MVQVLSMYYSLVCKVIVIVHDGSWSPSYLASSHRKWLTSFSIPWVRTLSMGSPCPTIMLPLMVVAVSLSHSTVRVGISQSDTDWRDGTTHTSVTHGVAAGHSVI